MLTGDTMALLKIGTFNIKNCYEKNKKIENAKILIDIIQKEKIDILGTQELTKEYEKILKKKLKNYKICGGYRFGNLPFFNKYNENNIIITNKNVLNSKTIRLPWIAKKLNDFKTSIQKKSIMPRIATLISIHDYKIGKLVVINTHLDHKISAVKQMQLDKIKKIISKYYEKYPIILTG
jgi:endonuclease/exonuclease/phosphatase family metal-dependent hydrolase